MVQLYNSSREGVDTLDFLISLYCIDIKSKKWTLQIFARSQHAWLEYRNSAKFLGAEKKKDMDLLLFRHKIPEDQGSQFLQENVKGQPSKMNSRGHPRNRNMKICSVWTNRIFSCHGRKIF